MLGNVLSPFDPREALTVHKAAKRATVTVGTIRNWCRDHMIGRKIGGSFRVSAVALHMYMDGNHAALKLYHAGDRANDVVRAYFNAAGIPLVRTVVVDTASEKTQFKQFA